MEIVKNRYGNDRVIEKISPTRLRITGESEFSRGSQDKDGNQTMFDFEGGPCLNVGGKIKYLGSNWNIKKIKPEASGKEGLATVLIDVSL
tara:strand:+ start:1171 stop:1440 length:270 start_codon:yes stop_codon:yes gene_type:complete